LERARERWATCVLTQLGFIRISSNPAVSRGSVNPAEAARLLAEMVRDRLHVFLEALPAPVSSPFLTSSIRLWGASKSPIPICWRWRGCVEASLLTFDARLEAWPDRVTRSRFITSA